MTSRMASQDRRELILEAATKAFAEGGYHGTSTDAVAREADVSQPYVVRMFGTKLELFLAVLGRSCQRIEDVFSAQLDGPFDPESEDDAERLGLAYTSLVEDRNLMRVMMHGFASGSVPEIGALARERMSSIFATLQRTGWGDDRVREFIAHGMLLNVLLGMGAFDEHLTEMPASLRDLVQSCFAPQL